MGYFFDNEISIIVFHLCNNLLDAGSILTKTYKSSLARRKILSVPKCFMRDEK